MHKLQNLINPQAINFRNCKLEIYVSANKHILIVNHLATQRLIIAGRWDRHARKMRSRCYRGIATVLALSTRHHLFFIFIWPRTYFTPFLFFKILTNESVRMGLNYWTIVLYLSKSMHQLIFIKFCSVTDSGIMMMKDLIMILCPSNVKITFQSGIIGQSWRVTFH